MRLVEDKFKNTVGKVLSQFKIYNPQLILYDKLVEQNLRPEKDFEIGGITAPLAFPKAKLAIDFETCQYNFEHIRQLERDQKRDKYLARKGWRVIHIEGFAIRRNIGLCIDKIKQALKPFLREV